MANSSVRGSFSSQNVSQDTEPIYLETSPLCTDDHTASTSFVYAGKTIAPNNPATHEDSPSDYGVDAPSFVVDAVQYAEESHVASLLHSGIEASCFVLVVQDTNESLESSLSDSGIDAPSLLDVVPSTNEDPDGPLSDSNIAANSFVLVVQDTNESTDAPLSNSVKENETAEVLLPFSDEHSSFRKPVCNVCEQLLTDLPEKDAATHLEICQLKRKLEVEQEKSRVLRVKLKMKKNELALLRKRKSLPPSTSPVAIEVFENVITNGCKKVQGRRYSVKLKRFALRQSFWSNSGYEDLRKHFCLPSRRTISRKLEGITGDPGILTSVIQHIKDQIESGRFGKECVMLIDEMCLASRVSWDPQTKKVTGFTEMNGKNESSHTLATAALFIFLVGLNGRRWRFPVSYVLTDHFKGDDLIPVLNNVLTATHEAGIDVRGIVFDGLSANKTYAESCGASFDVKNLMHYFFHPVTGKYVYIFWDAVHMIKLARNLLADKKEVFIPGYEKPARFSHIEALHQFQVKHKCRLANKLSPIHVQFRNKIMKVI